MNTTTTTILVCGKCGRTQENETARTSGWVIKLVNPRNGWLRIRCTECAATRRTPRTR